MTDSKNGNASKTPKIERLSLQRETVKDLLKTRTNIRTGITGPPCEGCANCITDVRPTRK